MGRCSPVPLVRGQAVGPASEGAPAWPGQRGTHGLTGRRPWAQARPGRCRCGQLAPPSEAQFSEEFCLDI
eukprot:6633800-Pyramimonas_sp.AAC.1